MKKNVVMEGFCRLKLDGTRHATNIFECAPEF